MTCLMTCLMALPTAAQSSRDSRDADRDSRQRGERPNFAEMSDAEREAMRQRMEERRAEYEKQRSEELRVRLEISKEDFEAISPLIDKVRNAQRERDMSRREIRSGFGQRGSTDDIELSKNGKAASSALEELQQAIEDDDSDAIKKHLTELRKARAALNQTLVEAQEELRSVCTAKWEAEFVVIGLLD